MVLTSVNGVGIFFDMLAELGHDARYLGKVRVAAIGERTAAALRERSIRADAVPADWVQESLAKTIPVGKASRILLPQASGAREALAKDLTGRGARVTTISIYDTVPDRDGIADLQKHLTRGRIHAVTFTSASTIEKLAERTKREDTGADVHGRCRGLHWSGHFVGIEVRRPCAAHRGAQTGNAELG